MEKPRFKPEKPSSPSTVQVLSPSSSGRRSSASNSPEFEFWMVRNPSFPQPQLLSADELIVDGVLLPLQLLPHHSEPSDSEEQKADLETPNPETQPEPGPGPESSAALTESSTVLSTSKRWRDIFRFGEKKTSTTTSSTAAEEKEKDKEKEKKKERKGGGGGGGGVTGTELNINIWPFSRSHSAGNSGNRPKLAAANATRKVSSAPCSRSNSAGESKSRKWPSSPGRGGVHLGRSSPVWQVRRGGSSLKNADRTGTPMMARNADKGVKKEATESRRDKNNGGGVGVGVGGRGGGGARARVLNLNVPMCIGYRPPLSCRSDASSTAAAACGINSSKGGRSTGGGGRSGGAAGNSGGSVGSLLNLRTIFSKKVY